MDMSVLTVGVKVTNDQKKIYVMRYISSRNWTIPNITINCDKDEENDTTCLKGAFSLIPDGVNLISLDKVVDCVDKESIKSEDGDENNSISVLHHSVIFEARVEASNDQSLSNVPMKFDYAQWIPEESLISVPYTNRITQKLVDFIESETPQLSVLSGMY